MKIRKQIEEKTSATIVPAGKCECALEFDPEVEDGLYKALRQGFKVDLNGDYLRAREGGDTSASLARSQNTGDIKASNA